MKRDLQLSFAAAALTAAGVVFTTLVPVNTAHARTSVDIRVGVPIQVGNVGINIGYSRYRGSFRGGHYPRGWWGPRWSIGAYVPILPIGYSRYIIDETPYYVYRDTYYVEDGRGYRVIRGPERASDTSAAVISEPGPAPVVIAAPRESADPNQPVPTFDNPAKTGQLTATPRNGQSETAATYDRIECESAASKLTSFYPGQSPDNAEKKAAYTKAVVSCLETRGYTVK